eukprot:2786241-Rhodomonas_salina.1
MRNGASAGAFSHLSSRASLIRFLFLVQAAQPTTSGPGSVYQARRAYCRLLRQSVCIRLRPGERLW